MKQGIEQGIQQNKMEMVKKMLKKNMKIEEIEEITGLSKEKIEKYNNT